MQEQVTSSIRFSQGTRSANVMSICFETARQLGGIHYLWPGWAGNIYHKPKRNFLTPLFKKQKIHNPP